LAAELFGLHLASSAVQKGYDAKDEQGYTYQIKSRFVDNLNENTSFDFKSIDEQFDYLICVFLSRESFDLLEIIRVPYEVVRELGRKNGSDFRFRWNKKNADDSRIERVDFLPIKPIERKQFVMTKLIKT